MPENDLSRRLIERNDSSNQRPGLSIQRSARRRHPSTAAPAMTNVQSLESTVSASDARCVQLAAVASSCGAAGSVIAVDGLETTVTG